MSSFDIDQWLSDRPKWLQLAARCLLKTRTLTDEKISKLADLCLKEAEGNFPEIDCNIPKGCFDKKESEALRLCSISDVIGINKLAPKKALEFGENNITIIYGKNGSGKSGYVRLLKQVCNVRDCMCEEIYPNIFSGEEKKQHAKITYLKNGASLTYKWLGEGYCENLCSVEIFDTTFGQVFTEREGEVCYEPPILAFFSLLSKVSEKVTEKLKAKEENYKSEMPRFPESLEGTIAADWLKKITSNTTQEDINRQCIFTDEDNKELHLLHTRLSEQDPLEKSKQLEKKKNHADELIKLFEKYYEQLSDGNCRKVLNAKAESLKKALVATTAAEEVFSGRKLEGIGSETWKELWRSARKYSEEIAYKGRNFPFIDNGAVCVLCHQPLSSEAKERFVSFESYIKDETQQEAQLAETKYQAIINTIEDIPNDEELQTKIDAIGIESDNTITAIKKTFQDLQKRKIELISAKEEVAIRPLPKKLTWRDDVKNISSSYQDLAKKYLDDTKQDNRIELQQKQKDMEAKKWLAEQKQAIENEVNRIKILQKIKNAKNITDTTMLSRKKGDLSKELITDTFVSRFNKELKEMKASELKVKLLKSGVSKGHVLHKIQLDATSKYSLNDVLSEGERRIVSIAAFFADITARESLVPLIFDDPISSLDQDYEEAVVKRLCELASNRQVIIFTHRLSLVALVRTYAKKVNIAPEITCIYSEPWGTGEPELLPLFAKATSKALKTLINEYLPKAKKIYKDKGIGEYKPKAKSLCTEFRILLERIIENDLLADIVQRYRRDVQTKGKIGKLAKISKEDCSYLDDLMTKYSCYEHSQPQEAPCELPKPDELEEDFQGLSEWLSKFGDRTETFSLTSDDITDVPV